MVHVCSTRIVYNLNLLFFLFTKKKVEGSRRGSKKGSRKGEGCPEGGSRYCLHLCHYCDSEIMELKDYQNSVD